MGAIATTTLADLRRRRLQAAVLVGVLFLACGAATLALSILDGSQAPFDRAFARASGAHLVVDFAASVSDRDLAVTSTAERVTASAGPWPIGTAAFLAKLGMIDGQPVSGRPASDAALDAVTITAGRWWQVPGEVVVGQVTAAFLAKDVGDTIALYPPARRGPTVSGGSQPAGSGEKEFVPPGGGPETQVEPTATLTVVGIAASVSTPVVAAWMSPADIAALTPGTPPARQMLYRVDPAATATDLSAALTSLTDDLPADAVLATRTYLETRDGVEDTARLYVPILLAFSIFALLAAGFTIANIVGGVVLAGYREIGVMKAIGFTPTQVAVILLAQILLPVAGGAIAGVIAGSLASQPTIERLTRSFGLPAAAAPSPVLAIVVLGVALALAFLAAIGPAIRAGRLSPVGALTLGAGPSTRPDGGRLRRLGLRLPAGISVRLGVATGVAHPIRAAMTLGALLVGVAAVTFALGLNLSLVRVMTQLNRNEASPVRVQILDPAIEPAEVGAAIARQPGTGRFVSVGQTEVAVQGLGVAPFVGYDGDSGWIGYELIHGRWFAGPGEAVAPTTVFTLTGLRLGDAIELARDGRMVTVRLVGEIFDTADEWPDHLVIRGTWADVVQVDPAARPSSWEVAPKEGVSPGEYSSALESATGGRIAADTVDDSSSDEEFLLFLSVVTFMGVVLTAISLGGVFNTVLLETRQRTREMAVLKALGLTPRQVVAMVVSSVVPAGLAAGLLGVPLGIVFQRVVLAYMGETAAKTAIPASAFDVLAPAAFVALALAGLAIAAIGAYLPAQRAGRARIAPVLQAE
jgi:putative ABC transport system permease protein